MPEPKREVCRCPTYHSYGGNSLRSLIEAPLITREVLPETYFCWWLWQLMLKQDRFYSFKHHANVEPYKFLIFLVLETPFRISSALQLQYLNA
jgi:hypothetical protein